MLTINSLYHHYENIQRFFPYVKIENFVEKKIDIFDIFSQNIDCGYTLELPCGGGSSE